MDVHKPRPIHNWREFLKEVGTIVLGVCIALAAEQTVEYFHWRSEVAIARTALRDEIAHNSRFNAFRIAVAPCIGRQLNEAQTLIGALAHNRPGFPYQGAPYQDAPTGLGSRLDDSEWQSDRSSQVLTHFPRAELALMGRYYAQIPGMTDWQSDEGRAWSGLSVLRDAPDGLSPADIAQLRLNLHLARRMAYLIRLNAQRQLAVMDQLGIKPLAADPARIALKCAPQPREVPPDDQRIPE